MRAAWGPILCLDPWKQGDPRRQRSLDVLMDALMGSDDALEAAGPPLISLLAPPGFRRSIVVRVGAGEYDCTSPLEVPKGSRTARWAMLCGWLEAWDDLTLARRACLVALLAQLNLFEHVVALADEVPAEPESDLEEHYVYEVARIVQRLDIHLPVPPELFTSLLEGGRSWRVKVACANQLMVRGSRYERNEALAMRGYETGLELLEHAHGIDPFVAALMASRFWRAAALATTTFRSAVETDRAMSEAVVANARLQALARGAMNEQLADEDTALVLIALVKVGTFRPEWSEAEEHARKLLELDPGEPNHLLNVGEMWRSRGRAYEAALIFAHGARLGTMFGALSGWNAGTTFEQCGDLRAALAAYELALELDGRMVSAREGAARCRQAMARRP